MLHLGLQNFCSSISPLEIGMILQKLNCGDTSEILSGYSIGNQCLVDYEYRQVSNTSPTLAGYNIVDHSDVVGASPIGAAPTTSSFST